MSTQISILLKVLLFLMMTCSFIAYHNFYDIGDVIQELYPEGAAYVLTGIEYSGLDWRDSREKPTEEVLSARLKELQDAEPMQLLREERDRRLAETDWWAMKEVDGWQMSPQQRVYRKNLRDMPETSPYPMLNENGELTNVDWPEKP